MRNLEREIGSLCRKVARQVSEGRETPIHVTATRSPITWDVSASLRRWPSVSTGPGSRLVWSGPPLVARSSLSKQPRCPAKEERLDPDRPAGGCDERVGHGRAKLCTLQCQRLGLAEECLRGPERPYPCSRWSYPQGWTIGWCDDGDRPGLAGQRAQCPLRCGHDWRNYPARQSNADWWRQREGAGRLPLWHSYGYPARKERSDLVEDLPKELRDEMTLSLPPIFDRCWKTLSKLPPRKKRKTTRMGMVANAKATRPIKMTRLTRPIKPIKPIKLPRKHLRK